MDHIDIAYNREMKPLEAVLADVKNPGEFFVSGVEEMPMPRIEVDGAGAMSFPVPDSQIAALIKKAERAPYGRGEETIIDTSVRNVWQISAREVKIAGKSWEENFRHILGRVSAGLGCDADTVSAELYKMPVYDEGGFFLAHRDTEKTEGMFGTLVLTLPSVYTGGALRIKHAGREVTVETNASDPSEISYVAFYADCEHEALPVRAGNRVCLVYNLLQRSSKRKRAVPRAPEYESRIAETATILNQALASADAPAKIAWLLEHQYSPAGLSFAALKGADAARAKVLLRAAESAHCEAHLGIVHIGESGAAECDYDTYRSRRYRYRSYAGEDFSDEDSSFTAVSVDEAWRYIDEWRDAGDRVVEFGQIPVAENELLPAGALDGEPPDERRVTEASGNEGATYERSYHRAALVLWRQTRMTEVLLQAGVASALPYLKKLAAGGKSARARALAAAEQVLNAWPVKEPGWAIHSHNWDPGRAPERIEMIGVLVRLKEPLLLERFLRKALIPGYDGSENAALMASVKVLGNARANEVISALVSTAMLRRPAETVQLLLALSENPAGLLDVAKAAVAGLHDVKEGRADTPTFVWNLGGREPELGPQFIDNLLQALRNFGDESLCEAAAAKIAARPETFTPVTLVVPAIASLSECGNQTPALQGSVRLLWTSAAEFLLDRSEFPPQPPTDWHQKVTIGCKCPLCGELKAFALDPIARVHRFRVRKELRQHVHYAIDRSHLEMTHVTERTGSPQTLVCTKDRRIFDRRMREFEIEISAMRTLVSLALRYGAVPLTARMSAAIERGTS